MRVPPAQPWAISVQPLLRAPGIGIVQRLRHSRDARVEDEAVHVGQLGAERARQAQVEEAVQRHRPAHVDQQHQARTHPAAVLPGQVERRAAAGHAAPDRCWQVEAAAVPGARLAAQLDEPQLPGKAPHQRLDIQRMLALGQVAEVGRGQQFLAARRLARPQLVAVVHRIADRRRGRSGHSPLNAPSSASRRSGRCHRLAGRNQASNSSSKRCHSSQRPHSSACRLQRRIARIQHAHALRGLQHLRRRRRRPRQSRWRAGSRRIPSAARRPGHQALAGPGSTCGRQSRDDLTREGRRGRHAS